MDGHVILEEREMKKLTSILIVFLMIVQVFGPGPRAYAVEVEGLVMTLDTSKTNVLAGEEFSYFINYSVSSTASNFPNPKITFTLPEGITYTGVTNSNLTTSTVVDCEQFLGCKEVTFTFKNGELPAGVSGQLVVKGKFDNYVTPNGTTVTAKSVFSATVDGNPVTLDSNEITVTAEASANWSVKLSRKSPVAMPVLDSDVQYEIVVQSIPSPSGYGMLDIKNIVLTAQLADGAIFVSASDGGTLAARNTVVWNLPDDIKNTRLVEFIVHYPSSIADQVTTEAEMVYTPMGHPRTSITGSNTHGFDVTPIDLGAQLQVSVKDDVKEIAHGDMITYQVNGMANKANIALQGGELILMMPTQTMDQKPIHFEVDSVRTATFTGISDYDLYYTLQDNPLPQDWLLWQTVNTSNPSILDPSTLNDIAGIKGIRVNFGSMPTTFNQLSPFEFTYHVKAPYPAQESAVVRQDAAFHYSFNGVSKTSETSTEIQLVSPRPLLQLQSISSKTILQPTEVTTYTLTVNNHPRSSDQLVNPVITDILPADLEYVPASWTVSMPQSVANGPVFRLEPLANGDTKLTWSWDDSNPMVLPINDSIVIQFDVRVKDGTPIKTLQNKFSLTTSTYLNDVNYSNTQTPDAEFYSVQSQSNITIPESVALLTEMRVKGEMDADWSTYPSIGTTTSGGKANYQLHIKNIGNVPTKDLVIVNTFPRIGDTSVLNGAVGRMTQWGPLLVGEAQAPDYVSIYYSTMPNIRMDPITGIDNGIWFMTPPEDITTVQALKFVFDADYVIDPLNSVTLQWSLRAPAWAPTGGEVAWNSFAYKMNRASGESILPVEPMKIGMKTDPDPKAQIGDFVWFDLNENGLRDGFEVGINGIIVELYDESGNKLDETVTANDFFGHPGYYLFPNLEPGNYRVKFNSAPWYEEEVTHIIRLAQGERSYSIDVGLVIKKGSIGDFVWLDENQNGIQNIGETGVNGVEVQLLNDQGQLLMTTTTATHGGNQGYYQFNRLNPGNYQVKFVLPSTEYRFTAQQSGSDRTKDSDADPTTGLTNIVAVAQGEEIFTVDAGLYKISVPQPSQPSTNPPAPPTSEPVQPTVGIYYPMIDREAFISNLRKKIEQANSSPRNTELTAIKGHWAEKTIARFVQLGLITAYDDGTFNPNEEITRAEFAILLTRVFEFTRAIQETAVLNDIRNHSAEEDIVKLLNAGVFKGYGDRSFKPDQGIRREEVVVVLSRIVNFDTLNKDEDKGQFGDLAKASAYARDTIVIAAKAGIVNGKDANLFDPAGKNTWAEVLTLIMNIFNLDDDVKQLLENTRE